MFTVQNNSKLSTQKIDLALLNLEKLGYIITKKSKLSNHKRIEIVIPPPVHHIPYKDIPQIFMDQLTK